MEEFNEIKIRVSDITNVNLVKYGGVNSVLTRYLSINKRSQKISYPRQIVWAGLKEQFPLVVLNTVLSRLPIFRGAVI